MSANRPTTRDEIEAAVWRLTGWRGDASAVDELLRLIDSYTRERGVSLVAGAKRTGPRGPVPIGERWCKGCETVQELANFTRDKSTKDGYRSKCKRCEKRQRALRYPTTAWLNG